MTCTLEISRASSISSDPAECSVIDARSISACAAAVDPSTDGTLPSDPADRLASTSRIVPAVAATAGMILATTSAEPERRSARSVTVTTGGTRLTTCTVGVDATGGCRPLVLSVGGTRGGGGGFGIAAREDGRLAASHPPARPRLHERRRRGRRRRDEAGQRQREPRERRLRRGLPARAVARLAQVVISLPDALEPDARDGLDPARVALDPRVHARVRRFIARLLPRVGLVRRHSRRVAVAGRSVDSCDARVDSCGAFPLHLRGEPAHGLDVRGDDVHRVDVRRARAGKVARCARASRSSRGGGIAGGHSCAGGRGSGGRSGARGSFDAPDRRRASVGSHRQLERDVTALSQGREIVRRGRRAVAVSAEHGVDHLRDLRGARGALGDANLAHVHQVGRHPVRVPVRVPRADADALGGALRRGGRVRRALHEQDRVSVGEARAGDALIVLEHAAAVDEALRRGGHAADGLDHAFQREDVDLNEPWKGVG